MDDIRAVMDAEAVERAALFAAHEATRLAVLFAASYPERTAGLILHEPSVRGRRGPRLSLGADRRRVASMAAQGHGTLGRDGVLRGECFVTTRPRSPTTRGSATGRAATCDPAPARAPPRRFSEWSWTATCRTSSARSGCRRWSRTDRPRARSPSTWPHASGAPSGRDPPRRRLLVGPAGGQPGSARRDSQVVSGLDRPTDADGVLATFLFTDIVGSTDRAAELATRAGARCWSATTPWSGAGWPSSAERRSGRPATASSRCSMAPVGRSGARVPSVTTCARSASRYSGRAAYRRGPTDRRTRGRNCGPHGGASGEPVRTGEVLVSRTVKDLVAGAGFIFADRGRHELKGVPGEWELYAVE